MLFFKLLLLIGSLISPAPFRTEQVYEDPKDCECRDVRDARGKVRRVCTC